MVEGNFEWTQLVNVDDQFTLAKFNNSTPGQFIALDDPTKMVGRQANGTVYHPEFKFFVRSPSNYVGIGGRAVGYYTWKPEQDDDVRYFMENWDTSPTQWPYLVTKKEWDFENRVFTREIDLSLRPKREWFRSSVEWSMDAGARIESLSEDFGIGCWVNKDMYQWTDDVIVLDAGDVTEAVRPQADLVYLVALGGDVKLNNKKDLLDGGFIRLASDKVEIEALGPVTIALRYK